MYSKKPIITISNSARIDNLTGKCSGTTYSPNTLMIILMIVYPVYKNGIIKSFPMVKQMIETKNTIIEYMKWTIMKYVCDSLMLKRGFLNIFTVFMISKIGTPRTIIRINTDPNNTSRSTIGSILIILSPQMQIIHLTHRQPYKPFLPLKHFLTV